MKIGLVLSGGGSRGMVHLGVLKAMEELNIVPSYVSGASAGALIGAMYCAGHKALEIKKIIEKSGVKRNFNLALNKLGLFSMGRIQRILKQYLPENFAQLKIPLVVSTTNIKKGEVKYFSERALIAPVVASCAIPGIFTPIIIDGKAYIDGGIVNNMPIEPIVDKCDFIIGVNLMPVERKMPIKSAKDIIMKCLMLGIGTQTDLKLDKFDLVIQPENISKFNGLSMSKAQEMFDLGYKFGMEALKNSVCV